MTLKQFDEKKPNNNANKSIWIINASTSVTIANNNQLILFCSGRVLEGPTRVIVNMFLRSISKMNDLYMVSATIHQQSLQSMHI